MSEEKGELWNIRAHWKCGVCWNSSRTETVFNDNTEFQDHIGRHCHICNKEYTSSGAWQRHQSNHYLRNVLKVGGQSPFRILLILNHFLFDTHSKTHHSLDFQ